MRRRKHLVDGQSERPWSVPVARAEVPETGRHFDITADDSTRAAVAKLAGLRALPRLLASFDVVPHGAEGLRVAGRVAAVVGQTCVVTLEPIDNEIEEVVDIVFAPAAAPPLATADGERAVEVTDDDPPEPLVDGVVDLGALATEFVVLAIDPYPRKAGVVFEPPAGGEAAASPFAVLGALKQRQNRDGG
jgi:Large ribosomal RNA subunit accumulation protein YceD